MVHTKEPLRLIAAATVFLNLTGAFCVAADDLDTVRMDLLVVIQLEVDVLDDKGPDVVAEAVGVEMSLRKSAAVCERHSLYSSP